MIFKSSFKITDMHAKRAGTPSPGRQRTWKSVMRRLSPGPGNGAGTAVGAAVAAAVASVASCCTPPSAGSPARGCQTKCTRPSKRCKRVGGCKPGLGSNAGSTGDRCAARENGLCRCSARTLGCRSDQLKQAAAPEAGAAAAATATTTTTTSTSTAAVWGLRRSAATDSSLSFPRLPPLLFLSPQTHAQKHETKARGLSKYKTHGCKKVHHACMQVNTHAHTCAEACSSPGSFVAGSAVAGLGFLCCCSAGLAVSLAAAAAAAAAAAIEGGLPTGVCVSAACACKVHKACAAVEGGLPTGICISTVCAHTVQPSMRSCGGRGAHWHLCLRGLRSYSATRARAATP